MDTPGLTVDKLQSGEAPSEVSMEDALAVYKERLKALTEMHGVKHNIFLKPLKERKKLRRLNLPKTIKCKICGKGFHVQHKLVSHMRSHAVDKPFKCNICKHCFKSLANLWTHMRTRHPGYYMYKCEICQEPFEFMNGLKMHRINVHHLLEEPRAVVLLRTSEDSSISGDTEFTKQMCASPSLKTKRPEPELCQERAGTRGDIDGLEETSEDLPFSETSKKQIHAACSLKERPQPETNREVTVTQESIDGIKDNACELESEKTVSKTGYSCESCDARFPYVSQLEVHQRVHTGDRPYSCHLCDSNFKQLGALLTHFKKKHPKNKPYRCEFCLEEFSFHKDFKNHKYNVHELDNKPLNTTTVDGEGSSCSLMSNKSFLSKPNDSLPGTEMLNADAETSTTTSEPTHDLTRACENEKTASKTGYSCESCDASFPYVSQLEVHQRVHTGERPYSCHLCDSSFKQLGALLTHFKNKHPKNKPYRCEFCLEEFRSHKEFKNHKYNVHELDNKPLDTTTVDGEGSNCSLTSEKSSMSKANDSSPGAEKLLHTGTETSTTKPVATNEFGEISCKEFKDRHLLVEHRQRHADDRQFGCPWCSSTFKSKSTLSGHLHAKHPGKKMYRCTSCNLQFSRQSEWMGHNYSVHESGGNPADSTPPEDDSLRQLSGRAQSDKSDEFKHVDHNIPVKIKEEPMEDSPLIFEHEGIVCGGIGTEVSYPSESDRLAAKTVAVRNFGCDTEDLSLVIQYLSAIVDHSMGTGDFKPCLEPKINLNYSKSEELQNAGQEKVVVLCNFCGASYQSSAGLAFHIRDKHQESLPFQCQACPRRFATTTSLAFHLETHASVIPFTCGTCGMEFASRTRLKCHESRIHLKGKIFTCDVCSVSFKKLSTLKVHRARHFTSEGELRPVPARNFPCEFCSKRYIDKERRQRHIFQSHRGMKSFSCNDCASSFRTMTSLREHRREVHRVPVHLCDLCGDKFSRYQTLRDHASRRHGVLLPDTPANGLPRSAEQASRGGDSLMCEKCAKSFDTLSALRAHNATHHPKVKMHCEICDYTTPNSRYMKIHKTKEHGIEGATVHTCEICGKVFYFRFRFEAHRNLHQKVKKFFCEICDHASYSRANLTRHQFIKH